MNHIYYMGKNIKNLDGEAINKKKEEILKQLKDGTISLYLELLDTCTPYAFYKIMNEEIEQEGKKIKVKDLKIFSIQNVLTYSVLFQENDAFIYGTLYEYILEREELLAYYKRNQTMFSLINKAILTQDWDFLTQIQGFLKQFPCYDWYFSLKSTAKSLKRVKKS